jgi:NADP-dependent 3-hydroxy acid dehydrogenase YdfG
MHILITGGTRGIGLGIVIELLKKGHKVSYTGTSESSISKHIGLLKGDFNPIVCDVRKKSDLVNAKDKALEVYGDIHIWINNAGVDQARETLDKLTEEEIHHVVDVNIVGSMLGTSVALELFKKQGFGYVYNFEGLGSNNMKVPKTIVYGTTKRALTYFSKACNKEIREYPDIFVGTIQPGMVFTDLLLSNMNEEGMKIARILGDTVSNVAPFIVKNVINKKLNIKYLSNLKIIGRFLMSPFKKNNQNI